MGFEHHLFQINHWLSSSHSILLLSAGDKNLLINEIQTHDKHKYGSSSEPILKTRKDKRELHGPQFGNCSFIGRRSFIPTNTCSSIMSSDERINRTFPASIIFVDIH
jgi:hypothetical protein